MATRVKPNSRPEDLTENNGLVVGMPDEASSAPQRYANEDPDALLRASLFRNLATPVRVLTVSNTDRKGAIEVVRAGLISLGSQYVLVYYPDSGEFPKSLRGIKKDEPFEVPLVFRDRTSPSLEAEYRRALVSLPATACGVSGKLRQTVTVFGTVQDLDHEEEITILPTGSRFVGPFQFLDLEEAEQLRSISLFEDSVIFGLRKNLAATTPLLVVPLIIGQGEYAIKSMSKAELNRVSTNAPPKATQLRLF